MINYRLIKRLEDYDLKDILSYLYKYFSTCDLNCKTNKYMDGLFISGNLSGASYFIYTLLTELNIECHLFSVLNNGVTTIFLVINCFEMDRDLILDPSTLVFGKADICFDYDLNTLFKLYPKGKIISYDNDLLSVPITKDNYTRSTLFGDVDPPYTKRFDK